MDSSGLSRRAETFRVHRIFYLALSSMAEELQPSKRKGNGVHVNWTMRTWCGNSENDLARSLLLCKRFPERHPTSWTSVKFLASFGWISTRNFSAHPFLVVPYRTAKVCCFRTLFDPNNYFVFITCFISWARSGDYISIFKFAFSLQLQFVLRSEDCLLKIGDPMRRALGQSPHFSTSKPRPALLLLNSPAENR